MDDAMEAIKSFVIYFDIPEKTVESSICSASKAFLRANTSASSL
jgi:hypothetical protein